MIFANRQQSVVLIFLGLVRILYAVSLRSAEENGAMSDAIQVKFDFPLNFGFEWRP